MLTRPHQEATRPQPDARAVSVGLMLCRGHGLRGVTLRGEGVRGG